MADWIRMRTSLLTNPRVTGMARVLLRNAEFMEWLCPGRPCSDGDEAVTKRDVRVVTRVVVGALIPVWGMANDAAASDGILRHATSQDVDEAAGVPGFGAAMEAVDWLLRMPDGKGIQFVNFEEHNSPQKERSLTAKTGAERTADWRNRKKQGGADEVSRDAARDGDVTSQRDDREEKKRREKSNTPHTPAGASRFDDFWSAWPKSDRKQDKAKCAQKWKRENLDAVADRILADVAAKRQSRKWQDDGGKFIEAPLVYLNGQRWEDGNEAAETPRQETFV